MITGQLLVMTYYNYESVTRQFYKLTRSVQMHHYSTQKTCSDQAYI